jgi:N-glycosylase/DNA lyase
MNLNLQDSYNLLKPQIKKKKIQFQSADPYAELMFCLCTPQTNAKKAWSAVETLMQYSQLPSVSTIATILGTSGVRFKNNKASYIIEAIKQFDNIMANTHDRNTVATMVKGYGLKEASHFLRNIGHGEQLCILDRHILRCLKEQNVISNVPKILTKKEYWNIEQKMIDFSYKVNIPVFDLDFIFWHQSHGELFK